jgi:NAD(P)-dependent dehydrogenase (short-subunit alcohol dehydrogenase family)
MTDRVGALITGGAGGIGSAVASRLGQDGYAVVLADTDETGLKEAGGDLRELDVEVRTVICDILDDGQVTEAVAVASRHAPLRLLVNVAGLGTPQTDDGRMILRVNLEGTARMCRACAPALDVGGSIVSIGSVSALRARADADDLLDDPLSPQWIDRWDDRAKDTWKAYGYSKRG